MNGVMPANVWIAIPSSVTTTARRGWTIPPPESHTEQFRRYTHGKAEGFNAQRCAACHEQTECRACHDIMPESHTSDFVKPRGTGMERHIMLATIRPRPA